MFQIKICGITRTEDATHAVEAGADAIGLNFYREGKRCLTLEHAAEIARLIGDRAMKVGVFVNSSVDEVERYQSVLGLDWIQLHGDETVDYVRQVPESTRLIRVYRMGVVSLEHIAQDLVKCQLAGRLPDVLMLDAAQVGSYGGTGVTVDWQSAANLYPLLRSQGLPALPWILAGGLTPANVADAIELAQPTAVDVASGVESAPGIKRPELVREFIRQARLAFKAPASDLPGC